MKFTPHEYQKRAIDTIISTPGAGLFLDMGLGKTVSTLTAINELKYNRLQVNRVLVIAPKTVAEGTWSLECEKWDHLKHLKISTILGTAKKRMAALEEKADIYVINRENLPWLVNTLKQKWFFDMVVVDESTSFKNQDSQRHKMLSAVLTKVNRVVLLSGTPSPNGVMDLWAQIYLLDRGERLGRNITAFRNVYFDVSRIYGAKNTNAFKYTPKPGATEKILEKISDICISMKTEDYIKLPDFIEHEVPVVLTDANRKMYDQLEETAVIEAVEAAEEAGTTIWAESAAALSSKLQQLANGCLYDEDHNTVVIHDQKLEALEELLEALAGAPALVFYAFQFDRERIRERLGKKYKVRVYEGLQDQLDWNSHKVDVLLAHPASCAYGLNLQQGGNHIIWYGLTWSYEQYAQANKRLHRQGQTEKVICHHIVCKGTRDEDVMTALTMKEACQNYVMESLKARVKKVTDRR